MANFEGTLWLFLNLGTSSGGQPWWTLPGASAGDGTASCADNPGGRSLPKRVDSINVACSCTQRPFTSGWHQSPRLAPCGRHGAGLWRKVGGVDPSVLLQREEAMHPFLGRRKVAAQITEKQKQSEVVCHLGRGIPLRAEQGGRRLQCLRRPKRSWRTEPASGAFV